MMSPQLTPGAWYWNGAREIRRVDSVEGDTVSYQHADGTGTCTVQAFTKWAVRDVPPVELEALRAKIRAAGVRLTASQKNLMVKLNGHRITIGANDHIVARCLQEKGLVITNKSDDGEKLTIELTRHGQYVNEILLHGKEITLP